jgi:phage N-6-adenine-methyltransferase
LPVSPVMFSTGKDDWDTPDELFDTLDAEFSFNLDVAASHKNNKCRDYISEGVDALSVYWGPPGTRCWCNPPYSRGLQGKFIAQAAGQRKRDILTVMLLPARTDTKSFHAFIWDAEKHKPREGVEVRFIKGRLKFGGAVNSAPFPSMIVIFRPEAS